MMHRIPPRPAANEVYRLPPPLFDARCRACWFVVAALALVIASFWSLDLQWSRFLSADALRRMGRDDLIGSGPEHLVPYWQPRGGASDAKPPSRRKGPRPGAMLTQHTGLPPMPATPRRGKPLRRKP